MSTGETTPAAEDLVQPSMSMEAVWLSEHSVTEAGVMDTFCIGAIHPAEDLRPDEKHELLSAFNADMQMLAWLLGVNPRWLGMSYELVVTLGHSLNKTPSLAGPEMLLRYEDKAVGKSLAHMWALSFDNRIGRTLLKTQRGAASLLCPLSSSAGASAAVMRHPLTQLLYSVLEGVFVDFDLERGMSHLALQAEDLDTPMHKPFSGEAYWSHPAEVFARSFEAFVADELRSSLPNTPPLTRHLISDTYSEARQRMYPPATERERNRSRFKALFSAMNTSKKHSHQ